MTTATVLLRLPQVVARTGRSRTRIYADMAVGTFPKAIRNGPHSVAWIEAEVEAWIRDRIAGSRPELKKAA